MGAPFVGSRYKILPRTLHRAAVCIRVLGKILVFNRPKASVWP